MFVIVFYVVNVADRNVSNINKVSLDNTSVAKLY